MVAMPSSSASADASVDLPYPPGADTSAARAATSRPTKRGREIGWAAGLARDIGRGDGTGTTRRRRDPAAHDVVRLRPAPRLVVRHWYATE